MAENDADFARDLGYLDKFLAGLATHAKSLPEPAGSRLAALVAEELVRWREITSLLQGEPVTEEGPEPEVSLGEDDASTHPGADDGPTALTEAAPGDTQTSIPAMSARPLSAPPASRTSPPPSRRASFTVGSLLDPPKKR
jgi:hypothetical protein